MLVIGASDTLAGVAGTATAITVTVTGVSATVSTGVETLGKLYQGQLPNAAATLFTVPVGQAYVIKTISITNSIGSSVSGVQIFLSGTAGTNSLVGPLTLQSHSTITFSENGWATTDANGQILVASITGGITQLTGDVTAGPGSGSQVATVVKVNGAAVPASQPILASNASNQIVVPTTTGSGTTAVLATSPTFTTSATSPVVYGGSAAGSTLTLDGTSNGAPSNAYVLLNPAGQGFVGIGTSIPTTAPLVVNGLGAAGQIALTDIASTTKVAGIGVEGTAGNIIIGDAVGDLSFYCTGAKMNFSSNAGGSIQATLLGNGNFGIGTTTPHSKLAVVGLPVFLSNALAIAGGLSAGDFYRTGADPDLVAVVH